MLGERCNAAVATIFRQGIYIRRRRMDTEFTYDWPMPTLTSVPIGRRLEGQTEAAAHPRA